MSTRSFRTPHAQTFFAARDATPLARLAAGHEPLFRGPCRAHESLSELMFARETASSFEASGSSNTTIARRVSCARERLSTLTHVLLSRVIHDAFAFHETLRSRVRTSFSACSPNCFGGAARDFAHGKFTPRTLLSQSPFLFLLGRGRRLRALIFNVFSSRQLGFFVSESAALPELLSLPSRAPHRNNCPQFPTHSSHCSQTLDDEARCASESVSFQIGRAHV